MYSKFIPIWIKSNKLICLEQFKQKIFRNTYIVILNKETSITSEITKEKIITIIAHILDFH